MTTDIDHRGPDARGVQVLDSPNGHRATLGAVRLRIIDLAPAADQPLADASGEVWVAFNGELYNFRELRAELVAAGFAFRSSSDTECLVNLYRHLGGDVDRMLSRLRGMFAFALFDTTTGRAVLARDRLGIKPLHWVPTAGGLVFCSEQRPLARVGAVSGAFDENAVAGYLAKGVVPSGTRFLRDVRQLGPGESLTWDGGEPKIERYWRPVFTMRADFGDRDLAARELRASITDSVERHLVADRTVGVFLSSGTDSTAVATIAARAGAPRSLTVRFPDEPELDEGDDAATTARALGLDHVEVPTTGADAVKLLPEFLRSIDSPSSDAFNTWLVCRAARDAGLVVALSGTGGDELFAGYRTFQIVPRLKHALAVTNRIPSPLRDSAARLLRTRARGRLLARALQGGTGSAGAYHAMRRVFDDCEIAVTGLPAPALAGLPIDPGGIDAVTLLELGSYLPDQLLLDTDSVSMAHSLEVRVPLLDDRVVATALALPASVRVHGKQLLATAAGLGPRPPKRTFTLPIETWMHGPLRETVRNALFDHDLPFGDVLPDSFRTRVWDDFDAGRAHWTKAWSVAVLRLWPGANALV